MMEFRAELFVLVLFSFLYLKETESCAYSSTNELNICNAGITTGTRIGIRNTNVPNDQIVNCVCDIQTESILNLTALFDGPGYNNCGTKLYLDNFIFSCQDGPGTFVLNKTTTRLSLKKTYVTNDEWCMLLTSETNNIKITCYAIDQQSPEITTVRPASTSTSATAYPSLSITSHRTISTTEILLTAIPEFTSTSKSTSPHAARSTSSVITTISSLIFSSTRKTSALEKTSVTVPTVTTGYTHPEPHDDSSTISTTLITTESSSVVYPHSDTPPVNNPVTEANKTAATLPELAIIVISAVCGLLFIATIIAIIVHVVRKRGPNYNQNDMEDAINDSTFGSVIDAYKPRHVSAITNPMGSIAGVAQNNTGLSSFHVEDSATYASVNNLPGQNNEDLSVYPQHTIIRSPETKSRSPVPEADKVVQIQDTSDLYAVVNKPGSNKGSKTMNTANTQVVPPKGILKNQIRHEGSYVNMIDTTGETGAVEIRIDNLPELDHYYWEEKYATDSDEDMDTLNPIYNLTTSEMSTTL